MNRGALRVVLGLMWWCCRETATSHCKVSASANTSKPYRLFSTRTSYDEVRGEEVQEENLQGCEVVQIYHMIRHGTRYPGVDEIESIIQHLPDLRDTLIESKHQGCLKQKQIEKLRRWFVRFNPDNDLEIAEKGLQEMYELGYRMRKRFPRFFLSTAEEKQSTFDLRYTDNYRSSLSAKYFVQGLHHKDRGYMSKKEERHVGYSIPKEEDSLLLYSDLCYKYIKEKLQPDDKERIESTLFDNGFEVRDILEKINKHLGLSESMVNYEKLKAVYEACRFEYAIYGDDTWCEVLPEEIMKVLEYRQDMKYYWRYGQGKDINYQPSCLILKDITNVFNNVITNYQEGKHFQPAFRFGHSRSILPFYVRLGLYNDTEHLLASNYHRHKRRQWHLAKINPFSSNIAFILYKCDSDFKVRIFVNEHEVHLPGCTDSLCSWKDITTRWSETINYCDFDTICDQKEANIQNINNLNVNAFHHA